MKLHFEPSTISFRPLSCCDCSGAKACRTEFTVTMKLPDQQMTLGVADTDKGRGTRLTLVDDLLL
jgi:type III restriction enzyme